MNYNEFKQAIIEYAEKEGVSEYDLYYTSGSSTQVMAFEKVIDKFSDTATVGVCFRCVADGKMGYSNTQKLSREEAERLVRDAKAGAAVVESGDAAKIYAGDERYAEVAQSAETGSDVERLKAIALEIEQKAFAADSRIDSVPFAAAQHGMREVRLYNSHGLELSNRQSGYSLICSATASDGERKYSDFEVQEQIDADKIDVDGLVSKAVKGVISSIGGKTVPSGQYPIILSNHVAAQFLMCFSDIFSADMAQKGMSLLAGKEGQAVAAELVTIVDDPHRADSSDKSPFDDEGVATARKTVVERGELKTLLYDLKSAAKAGVKSTGNGRKRSYAADINVAPFAFYIEPGELSPEQLMQKAGKALLITQMKGLHAGADAVTGDFSLESKGFLVENGAVSRPAEQFTVAGNFFTLLKNITALSDDFAIENGFGAPDVLVSALSVAGANE